METSITLWMDESWKLYRVVSPYIQSYNPSKKAKFQKYEDYCNHYVKPKTPYSDHPDRLLDFIDVSIFDFMTENADRHHYELFTNHTDAVILLLDNAKSFGNYTRDEETLIAPLKQCCVIRTSTYERYHLRPYIGVTTLDCTVLSLRSYLTL